MLHVSLASYLHDIYTLGTAFSSTAKRTNQLSKCSQLHPINWDVKSKYSNIYHISEITNKCCDRLSIWRVTWRNQSLWSSILRLLLTIDLRIAPTSTWTSFIGSSLNRVLSTSSVSTALALNILSRSQTRIQPSHPRCENNYSFQSGYCSYKIKSFVKRLIFFIVLPMVISSPSSATIWFMGPSWHEVPSFLLNSNRILPFSHTKRFPQWHVEITCRNLEAQTIIFNPL